MRPRIPERLRLSERLHRRPALSAALLVLGTVLATAAVVPLQYDFSFTSLFVGEGEDYDRLRDYLERFGTDVNFVVVAVEADELFSASMMGELRELTEALEALEGVDEVVSPTNATDLHGDGGSLVSRDVIPTPLPTDEGAWDAIRALAVDHPLLTGTVFSEDGRHAAIVASYGLESGPTRCSDGVDNDAGGDVDCADTSCHAASAEGVCDRRDAEDDNASCTNGFDDDGDGLTDCASSSCSEVRACRWVGSAEASRDACSNGVDDDGDGVIDCLDEDCLLQPDVPFCDATAAIVQMVDALDERAAAEGWGRFHLGGIPIVSQEYTRVIQHDMKTYLPMTGLLVAFVLGLLFRSWRAVVLPMTAVGLSIVWAMGAMMATGGKLNMINSSMPTLLLVIAIADGVHIVSRYLEEAEHASSSSDAARRTMRHMAGACLLTSVTSAVGFGSLLSAHLPIIRGFGLYTGLGILLAYVVAMLLMPPVLAKARLPNAEERARAHGGDNVSHWVTAFFIRAVTEHRRLSLVAMAAIVIGLVVAASGVESDSRLMEELRPDNPVAMANAVIEEHHGGVLSGAILFNGAPGTFAEPETLRALDEVATFAESWRWEGESQLVSRAFSLADVVTEAHAEYAGDESRRTIPETRAAVVSLLDQVPAEQRASMVSADYAVAHLTLRQYTVGSKAWSELRADLEREVLRHPSLAGTDWYFTGSSTLGQDAMRFMTRDLITSLGLAVVIIMVLMSVLFRSIAIGLLSMIPNAFPLLVTLGMVGVLGIDIRVSTAVVFSISLGIAVDDTIHLLVRFREELTRPGADYEGALIRAMDGAGRAIVFTTIMLCIGFGTLTLSEFTAVRELGMLGGATLISALIGDLLALPLVLLWLRPKVRVGVDTSGGAK